MGYDYAIRGWLKFDQPIDLSAMSLQPGTGGYEFTEHDRLDTYMRVTGPHRNFITFATGAKKRTNFYLAALSAVMTSLGRASSLGLITITGEWTYDGKDRFVLARDGDLLTLPTMRIYDPLSPWNAVYQWTHYMGRSVEQLVPPDTAQLRDALAGKDSVKGWLYLPDLYRAGEESSQALMHDLVRQYSQLESGLAFMELYGRPHLLVGREGTDAATVVTLLAELTARHLKSYGLLYSSDQNEQPQLPIAIEAGRVKILPNIALTPGTEPRLFPTQSDAFEGLGRGFHAVPIRTALELQPLFNAVTSATNATPIPPHGGRRESTGVSGPCHLFEANGLACLLTTNNGQVPTKDHEGWPYLLVAYLVGAADPEQLQRLLRDLVKRLKSARIEVDVDRIWPRLR